MVYEQGSARTIGRDPHSGWEQWKRGSGRGGEEEAEKKRRHESIKFSQ